MLCRLVVVYVPYTHTRNVFPTFFLIRVDVCASFSFIHFSGYVFSSAYFFIVLSSSLPAWFKRKKNLDFLFPFRSFLPAERGKVLSSGVPNSDPNIFLLLFLCCLHPFAACLKSPALFLPSLLSYPRLLTSQSRGRGVKIFSSFLPILEFRFSPDDVFFPFQIFLKTFLHSSLNLELRQQ